MKRTRDRSNRARPAPAPNVSFGGLAVSGGADQSATVGQAGARAPISGETVRRPARNVMAKSRDGGMPITYYAPMERWQPTTARTAGHAPARVANRAYDPAAIEDIRTAGIHEGIRQAAMARHSILRTTGAVDVIRGLGPVWSDDSE